QLTGHTLATRYPSCQPLFPVRIQRVLERFAQPSSQELASDELTSALVGGRLKAARLARRLTLSEVASASGLTKGFLSKLERDKANASVASLIRLCEVLGVPVSSLFQAATGELVRRASYPRINFGGEQLVEYILTPR